MYEMLIYTAELKIPITTSLDEKKERVEALLKDLALVKCRNTVIGNALSRGISGALIFII